MANSQLVKIKNEARKRGFSDLQIKQPLLEHRSPVDDIEKAFASLQPKFKFKNLVCIFLDSEVYLVGDFQKTQIFVDKTDVRPFARLYTKYDLNKFRYYRKLSEL